MTLLKPDIREPQKQWYADLNYIEASMAITSNEQPANDVSSFKTDVILTSQCLGEIIL